MSVKPILLPDYQKELAWAKEVACLAGAFLKEHFGETHVVQSLTSSDVKLLLDQETQALIFSELEKRDPEASFLGEEGEQKCSSSEREWIIDPIDGTVNYFRHIPHFCVSMALRVRGEVVLGVIYDPMLGELFYGQRGQGAYCNGVRLQTSSYADWSQAVVFLTHSQGNRLQCEGGTCAAASFFKVRMGGSSALSLAYVAMGRFDAHLQGSLYLWDMAAGVLLLEEAGGKAYYEPKNREPFSLVATNGHLPAIFSYINK